MSTSAGKPAPSRKSLENGLHVLKAYGHFKWKPADGYSMGDHEMIRLKSWLNQATLEGKLTTGHWHKRTWVGFAVLSRLVRASLQRALEKGTQNWDVTLYKCLSMVLTSSLGARAGDVALACGYTEEFMQWRHVDLVLEGEPRLANLQATVTIQYGKGHKRQHDTETHRYLTPLTDPNSSHMCPIALLLIHSLRHSLVAGGTTLQNVLDHAFARPDRKIVWLFPKRPILAAISNIDGPQRCLLDKPASSDQLSATIREMGDTAGMLDRVHPHALRLGAARDISQLGPEASFGGTSEGVRQGMDHSHTALHDDTTDEYVGGNAADTYILRSKTGKQAKGREPRFASATTGEVEARGTTNTVLLEPTPMPPSAARPRRPPGRMGVNAPTGRPSARQASAAQAEEMHGITDTSARSQSAGRPLSIAGADVPHGRRRPADVSRLQQIDSAISTNEGGSDPLSLISATAADDLMDMVFPKKAQTSSRKSELALADGTDADKAEEATAFFDDFEQTDVADAVGPEAFIARYSRYNIVCNDGLALAARSSTSSGSILPNAMELYCMSGGSRDEPTPILFTCDQTPGCSFTHWYVESMRVHRAVCTEERVQAVSAAVEALPAMDEFKCSYEGCDYVPSPIGTRPPKNQLADHVANKHTFESKPCEHGCEPDKLYHTKDGYREHMRSQHRLGWPASCTYPDCNQSEKTFPTLNGIKYHLRAYHKLDDEEVLLYLPAPDAKRVFVEGQVCPMDGCDKSYDVQWHMEQHLVSRHKMQPAQAKTYLDKHGTFNIIVPERKPLKRNKPSKPRLGEAIDLLQQQEGKKRKIGPSSKTVDEEDEEE